MKIIKNNFCQVFVSEDNINSYSFEFENYCIEVKTYKDFNPDNQFNIPTLIIGWEFVKNIFKDIKISQKKIKKNLYWIFSEKEDFETSVSEKEKFIKKSLSEYLPDNYKTYDCILDGKISQKTDQIFSQENNFCYFSNNILYLYNKKKFIGINLQSIDYVYENQKEFLEKILKDFRLVFFNYENIPVFLKKKDNCIVTLENICWVCNNFVLNETSLHKFSPFTINEKYYVFLMFKFFELLNCKLSESEKILNRFSKKDYITDWLSSRKITFSNGKQIAIKYSNKRTITGRINCIDKRFNPQLLPKKSEIRKEIISEFQNGKIAVFDYVSFETKLSIFLTKDKDFIRTFEGKDVHIEISKIIFNKQEITPEERNVGKLINHAVIYGIGNEKLKNILKENKIPIKTIDKIKESLNPIFENSKKINDEFKKNKFIINPYDTIVYPNKDYAAYNNYIQSTAADLVIDKLFRIKNLLENKKSNFLFQVYDSFVFDIHPDEASIIEKIKENLENSGRHSFDVDFMIGNNLMECTEQISEEEMDFIN